MQNTHDHPDDQNMLDTGRDVIDAKYVKELGKLQPSIKALTEYSSLDGSANTLHKVPDRVVIQATVNASTTAEEINQMAPNMIAAAQTAGVGLTSITQSDQPMLECSSCGRQALCIKASKTGLGLKPCECGYAFYCDTECQRR